MHASNVVALNNAIFEACRRSVPQPWRRKPSHTAVDSGGAGFRVTSAQRTAPVVFQEGSKQRQGEEINARAANCSDWLRSAKVFTTVSSYIWGVCAPLVARPAAHRHAQFFPCLCSKRGSHYAPLLRRFVCRC